MPSIVFKLAILACTLTASGILALPLESDFEASSPPPKIGKRCTGSIQSLGDVAAAVECTTINVGGFTVPAGQTFTLPAPDNAVINLTGAITFGVAFWAGPLFVITGKNVTFNGNGHEFLGNGDQYWDGLGGNGGVTKPAPMIRINNSGSFSNLKIVNSPARTISVGGSSLTVSGLTIDNSAGDLPNSRSNGQPAGHNTDGFDVSATNVQIMNNSVKNQDDCLAINKGTLITFSGNTCSGGHGISIGSIASSAVVNGVTISGNTITNNVQALRIKTDANATGASVTNVVYSNNKATGTSQFGVLIDQSYPDTLGTPGTGVVINGVTFSGTNTIAVGSSAKRLEVNCGSTSSCIGTWNFAGLTITGGSAGAVKNAPVKGGSF